MAKPIDHSVTSTVATAGWKAGKWAVIGAVLAVAVPLGLGVGAIAAFAAGHALLAGVAALFAVGSAAITSTVGVTGAAVGGGIFGLLRGGHQVAAENAAYQNASQVKNVEAASKLTQAQMAGVQQGYGMGFQEGQQAVVAQLRAAQEQMLRQQVMGQQMAAGHAAKVEQQRAQAAGAAPQVA